MAAPLINNPGVSQNLINQKKIYENRRQTGEFLAEYFLRHKNNAAKFDFATKNFINKFILCYSDTSVFCAFAADNSLISIDAERPVTPASSLIYFYRKFSNFNLKNSHFNKNCLTRLWTLYEAIFKLLGGKEPTGKIIDCLLKAKCHCGRKGVLCYEKFNIAWQTLPFFGHWLALTRINNFLNEKLSPVKLYYINYNLLYI